MDIARIVRSSLLCDHDCLANQETKKAPDSFGYLSFVKMAKILQPTPKRTSLEVYCTGPVEFGTGTGLKLICLLQVQKLDQSGTGQAVRIAGPV